MPHTHGTDIVRLALVGAVSYLAIHQLWMFLRDREEPVFLWAAGWCACASLFLTGRVVLHAAETPSGAMAGGRLVLLGLFSATPVGINGAWAMLRRPRPKALDIASFAMLLPMAATLLTNWYWADPPQPSVDALGHTFWAPRFGNLFPAIAFYVVATGLYIVHLVIQARAYVDRTGRALVAIPGVLLVAALINDVLLADGILDTVQLADYPVAAVAFALSYAHLRHSSRQFEHIEADGAMRSRLIEKVIEAQERERKRIARDLHDATGQSLTSLMVRLRALEGTPEVEPIRDQVADLRRLTKNALEEVRRIAQGLHPVALADLGFEEAVRAYAEEFCAANELTTDIHMNGLQTHGRLPEPVEIVLYRILQEALHNVVRHSDASTVSILVDRTAHGVRVIVEDDGVGFDAEATTGLGLLSIRERAALCDGEVTIESTPGAGTTVYVSIPL